LSFLGETLAILAEELKYFAKNKGATLVGIASAERFSKAPKGHRPEDFLPGAKSLVSIALRMKKSSIVGLPKTMREYKADYKVANLKLDSLAWETARYLEDAGYEALAIPASSSYDARENFGDVSHKHVAVAAGLGRFGLNNLVLTPRYGPYVRFVTVITNAKLTPDESLAEDLCLKEKCLKCVKACPAGALNDYAYDPIEGWQMDKEKCHKYLHVISDGTVCGLCIKACPASER
jgi:epoxyqueuosine reductase